MKPLLDNAETCTHPPEWMHGGNARQAVVGRNGSILVVCLNCGAAEQKRDRVEVPTPEQLVAHAASLPLLPGWEDHVDTYSDADPGL